MKKALLMLLAALLCVGVFGGVASADGVHPTKDTQYYESLEDLYQATSGSTCSYGWTWVKDSEWYKSDRVEAGYRKYTRTCYKKVDGNTTSFLTHTAWVKEAPSGHTHKYEEMVLAGGSNLKTAATCTQAAVYYNACECGEISKFQTFSFGEPLGHKLEAVTGTPATCTTDGVEAHYKCSACGELFWDEEAKSPVEKQEDLVIGKTDHDWGDWVVTEMACEMGGSRTRTCKNNPEHTETELIPAADHKLEVVTGTPATCTENGVKEHYQCTRCDKLFLDSDAKTEVE